MDIHEYQAKELLSGFGVPIARGSVAYSPDQAVFVATELGGWHWAVKAQVHSGGRGKAGGVRLCRSALDAGAGRGAGLAAVRGGVHAGRDGRAAAPARVVRAGPGAAGGGAG